MDPNDYPPSAPRSGMVDREPPDSGELGRASWTLLHTMAAEYPNAPTTAERKQMTQFISLMAKMYPCPYCAEDFQESIQKHPPKVENKRTLAKWMCERHNEVNEKLGKDTFPCEKVWDAWGGEPTPEGAAPPASTSKGGAECHNERLCDLSTMFKQRIKADLKSRKAKAESQEGQ